MHNKEWNTKDFFSTLRSSIFEGINFYQTLYTFSFILLLFSACTIKIQEVGMLRLAATCALVVAMIIRAFRLYQNTNSKNYFEGTGFLLETGFIVILGVLAIVISYIVPYYPIPIRRIVLCICATYGIDCCRKLKERSHQFWVVNFLIFVFGFFVSQTAHVLYRESDGVNQLVNGFFCRLLPSTMGTIDGNTTWLGWGLPLFAGCLIIINWYKDHPCKEWNPYTVEEIGLSDHVVYYAVFFISSLFYCYISNTKRAPTIPIIGLLFVDIYALYLQNTQNSDRLVRRKIIEKIRLGQIISKIIGEKAPTKRPKNRLNKETKNEMGYFSQCIAHISQTILCSELRTELKVKNYLDMAASVYALLPTYDNEVCSTIGFIFGLSSMPTKKILEYQDKQKAKKDDKDDDSKKSIDKEIPSFLQAMRDTVSGNSEYMDFFYGTLFSGIYAGNLKCGLNIDEKERDLEIAEIRKYAEKSIEIIMGSENDRKQAETRRKIEETEQRRNEKWREADNLRQEIIDIIKNEKGSCDIQLTQKKEEYQKIKEDNSECMQKYEKYLSADRIMKYINANEEGLYDNYDHSDKLKEFGLDTIAELYIASEEKERSIKQQIKAFSKYQFIKKRKLCAELKKEKAEFRSKVKGLIGKEYKDRENILSEKEKLDDKEKDLINSFVNQLGKVEEEISDIITSIHMYEQDIDFVEQTKYGRMLVLSPTIYLTNKDLVDKYLLIMCEYKKETEMLTELGEVTDGPEDQKTSKSREKLIVSSKEFYDWLLESWLLAFPKTDGEEVPKNVPTEVTSAGTTPVGTTPAATTSAEDPLKGVAPGDKISNWKWVIDLWEKI